MRVTALRTMTSLSAGEPGPAASIGKLYWSEWHQRLGELAMAAQGPAGLLTHGTPTADAPDVPGELNALQRLYLFSRADTIYAGSSEIQRNIIAERVLGLPREPRP
jgi:alkylation response protein AidB-like acyl-CoA dehydrogenase